jgi:hypothetical protein
VETNQKPPIEQGDLVVIHWWDTLENSSWTEIPLIQARRDALCKSVGWFLNQDENCVRILTSINGKDIESAEAGYIIIPQKVVKTIEKVRDDELEVE